MLATGKDHFEWVPSSTPSRDEVKKVRFKKYKGKQDQSSGTLMGGSGTSSITSSPAESPREDTGYKELLEKVVLMQENMQKQLEAAQGAMMRERELREAARMAQGFEQSHTSEKSRLDVDQLLDRLKRFEKVLEEDSKKMSLAARRAAMGTRVHHQ